MDKLEPGTRIYYTGDQANIDGFGTITDVATNRGRTLYKILMDDGRKKSVPSYLFSEVFLGHGGTRFVTLAAYNAYRRKQFANSPFLKNIEYQPAI